jgi:hypothetical protein
MVLDTMDALQDSTRFDEFVMMSADADFSPLLRRLRRHNRRTVVFAAGAMSESYKASADLVIGIPTFIRDGLGVMEPDEDDASNHDPLPRMNTEGTGLRKRIGETVIRKVKSSSSPLPLATLAQHIHRDIAGARESNWAGAGSFGALLRQMDISGVVVDFSGDVVYAEPVNGVGIGDHSAAPVAASAAVMQPPATLPNTLEGAALDMAASSVIREVVGQAHRPVHLSAIGSQLRSKFSALTVGWNGAPTLAAMLDRMELSPLRREVLDDGSTFVIFDPARHTVQSVAVKDPAVAAILRAAEFPLMKAVDLKLVVQHLM